MRNEWKMSIENFSNMMIVYAIIYFDRNKKLFDQN